MSQDKLKKRGLGRGLEAILQSPDTDITLPGSPVKVFVIQTNEELMIARDAKRVVEG